MRASCIIEARPTRGVRSASNGMRMRNRSFARAHNHARMSAGGVQHTPTTEPKKANNLQLAAASDNKQTIAADGCCTPRSTPRWLKLQNAVWPTLGLVLALSAMATVLPNCAMAASEAAAESTNVVAGLISFVLHLDKHLAAMIQQYGTATYAILWTIVFCETGLVVTPFLPGDSLLFATGAFAGMGVLNLPLLLGVLLSAAILGDAVNYAIGSKLGKWMTGRGMVNPKYIQQTEEFYQKYGGKTIVIARFLPIVRTFAPFVAGVGKMDYSRFAMYNVVGALIWTLGFCGAGFFFGNLPAVKHNFTLVVAGIIVVSCLPVVWEVYNASKGRGGNGGASGGGKGAQPGSGGAAAA